MKINFFYKTKEIHCWVWDNWDHFHCKVLPSKWCQCVKVVAKFQRPKSLLKPSQTKGWTSVPPTCIAQVEMIHLKARCEHKYHMEYRLWIETGQCSVGSAVVRIQRCCCVFLLLLFSSLKLEVYSPKTQKHSCHAFVLCSDPFYRLPIFYRRQAGSKSLHSVKCRWALVLDSGV